MVKSKNNSPTGQAKIQSEEKNREGAQSNDKAPEEPVIKRVTKRIIVDRKKNTRIKDNNLNENPDVEVLDEEQSTDFNDSRSFAGDLDEFKEAEILDDEILPAIKEENDLEYEIDEEDFDIEKEVENEPGLVPVDSLQRYLVELRKYPLMTREEEKNVAIKAFENNDITARNSLVTANLRLVVKIAMEYRRAYSQILDLIQEGNAGLVQAVNRFNPYRGVKLSTYSAWWIRAYILKFLMDNKSLVRMGTTDAQRKLFFRLRGEAEKMYALTQKFDANLLAEKIGVEAQDVIEMQQRLSKNDLSLDTPVGEENDTRQVDLLLSHSEDADDVYQKKQLIALLTKQIDIIKTDLNERDAYIFYNRIMSDDPITLQEVGEKYGITRERARQLEARVIKKIKDKLIDSGILK